MKQMNNPEMVVDLIKTVLLLMAMPLFGTHQTFAQPAAGTIEVSPAATTDVESSVLVTDESGEAEQLKRKKSLLSLSWVMLFGICLLGMLVLLISLAMGSMVRRQVRQQTQSPPLRDSFWYLKNKQTIAEESEEVQKPTEET